MIVGLSMFDMVLDRVGRERAETLEPEVGSWAGVRGLNAGFVGAESPRATSHWGSAEALAEAYHAFDAEQEAPPPEPEIDTSIYGRLKRDEIARDMDLLPSDTPAQLQRKRRSFARLNHPDRAPAEWRDAATTRMKIANQLTDEALRKARAKQPAAA